MPGITRAVALRTWLACASSFLAVCILLLSVSVADAEPTLGSRANAVWSAHAGPVELDSDGDGGGQSDAELQKMQAQAAKQLVEARMRKYMALKHRLAAVTLAESAEEDQTKAALLKKEAILAKKDAALAKTEKDVAAAKKAITRLVTKAKALAQRHDQDAAKADKAKESVMDLESKAGTLEEKAQEEATKITAVKKATAEEEISIPHLLRTAREDEESAAHLKADARQRMDDSRRKTEEAYRLDRVAGEKEKEAKMIRGRLIAILEERTKLLDAKVRDAEREKSLASHGAKEAAAEAQRLAAQAAARAKLAVKAGRAAENLKESERRAEQMVRAEGVNVKAQAGLVDKAKREYDEVRKTLSGSEVREEERDKHEGEGDEDRQEDAKVGELKHEEVVMHHKASSAARGEPSVCRLKLLVYAAFSY
jgi:hypothetical protein